MSDIIDLLNTKNIHSTKKLIIEAALKLFAKNGYDDTTIEGIIQETNLSKGGVYHHFKSKEYIVESITDLYIEYADARRLDKIIDCRIRNVKKLRLKKC